MIKVTCNPPKNKKGYTVNFRHNIVKDKDGKYGRKIHRGLGTDNYEEAMKMVEDLEKLLNDEYWWDRSKKGEAYARFPEIVVDAYYDCMEAEMREENDYLNKITMPGKTEGYTKATIIGPSGVGKTSLVRNLAGTRKEKFPTTSTGRTTTCNMELIFSDKGDYEVVITFMTRPLVEMYIQECIEAAVDYCLNEAEETINDVKLSEKLLVHRDLIVRLTYILGDMSLKPASFNDEFDDVEENEEENEIGEYTYNQDLDEMLSTITEYISRVKDVAKVMRESGMKVDSPEFNFEELEEVLQLKEDIIEEIMKRFDLLSGGEKLNTKGKWVNAWYYHTPDREQFMQTVKMFSSNSKRAWGGLLTPIVHTMRVKGDFSPEYMEDKCKLVLFDGQGLGHKTTATSLPTDTAEYLKISDAVILVDNAQAPMLENVKMALKAVIEYGFASKVAIAYTHVDMMNGDNFTSFADKQTHVLAALDSYLYELKKNNVDVFSGVEANAIKANSFFFSGLDKRKSSNMTQAFARRMIDYLHTLLTESITCGDVCLRYDAMTLFEHLKLALHSYRKNWGEIIGYPSKTVNTEHWSRIKALTRRLAFFNQDNYNYELMPLADFRQEISAQLNIFLNRPMEVKPGETSDEVRVALISEIKSSINSKMTDFIKDTMWKNDEQFNRWNEAYSFTREYSTYYRAAKINEIFELAAPQIGEFAYNMTDIQKAYVMKVFEIVEDTLKEYGSKLEKFNY